MPIHLNPLLMSSSISPTETLASPGLSLDLKGEYELGGALRAACILQQKPISVTLDGPAIFTAALSVVLLIHFLDQYIAEALVILIPIALLIQNDYHNFLGLGPGGTPSTFAGYLRITFFRLLSISDPFKAPTPDPDQFPQHGILSLSALSYRAGPRPLVAGIAPQRQLDQQGSRNCYLAVRRAMESLGFAKPEVFGTERSCLEKHGLALFARHPLQTNCQGEICHIHDSDHSMHMCLHPDDIKEILEKGWGQRHPLARKSWLFKMPVSSDFVMVYAPRGQFCSSSFFCL